MIRQINWNFINNYIPPKQFAALRRCIIGEDVMLFVEPLENIEKQIRRMPGIYATEDLDAEQIRIGLHYYAGSTNVWVYELDRETGDATAFVCLNGDRYNAENGPIYLPEIVGARSVEIDLYWDGNRTLEDVMESMRP